MATDLSGLFVFFGAIAFIGLKMVVHFMLPKGDDLKGKLIWSYIVPALLGLGIMTAGYFLTSKCPAAGNIFSVGAIVVGGLPGLIVVFIMSKMFPILTAIVEPIMTAMWILLIVYIIEQVINILSIFFPPLLPVSMVLGIAVPIITLYILWGMFSKAFGNLPSCLGLGSGPSGEIPGTGGIRIGTYT